MGAIKDEQTRLPLVNLLTTISPAFMCGLNGKVNIQFDDFDEIKNHPVAG